MIRASRAARWIGTLLLLVEICLAYKPVFMMHGFSFSIHQGTVHDFDNIIEWIHQQHPGQIAIPLDLNTGDKSTKPMWEQLNQAVTLIRSYVQNNSSFSNGYHIIGHSQGGLMMRCLLEVMSDHQVDTFVSLAGVQYGQYGLAAFQHWFNNLTIEAVTALLYTKAMQNSFSVANYWHSPIAQSEYLSDNIYLPVLNNEVLTTNSKLYKQNFLKTKRVALFGSPADEILDPWFTSLFAFWDKSFGIVQMQQQPVYADDTFGLQTMDKEGRLAVTPVPNMHHVDWLNNEQIFTQYVMPLLV